MKRLTFISSVFALAVAMLAGCAVTDIHRSERLDANARWAMLPVANYAETPQAGERAEAILTTLLHQQGVRQINRAPGMTESGMPEFDQSAAFERGLNWARNNGYRYAVTGAVEEWQYKSGLDGEPAVGLSVRVVDVASGDTVYSASGSRGGWGFSTVSGTAQKLLGDLVGSMPF